jgi:hypothetical protein
LDLERHGGPTGVGVAIRLLERILALTAAIWHNHRTGRATALSLMAVTANPCSQSRDTVQHTT